MPNVDFKRSAGARWFRGGTADVLITDAGERQALVAVRQLGRTGLATGMVGSDPSAPAFASRFCGTRALVPSFVTDPKGYVDAVLEVCERDRARALLPMHDGSIDALHSRREEVERLVGLALAGSDAMHAATDKTRTFAAAHEFLRDSGSARATTAWMAGTCALPSGQPVGGTRRIGTPTASPAEGGKAP